MNTKTVMTSSAVVLMSAGIALSFLPQEIASAFFAGTDPLILQIVGALYFAFGMMNWTVKENLIGGIYGRPVLIGNLTHFVIGTMTLVKYILSGGSAPVLLAAAVVYTSFAMQFGVLFFHTPKQQSS
jgi:hypothetical protein